ASPPSQHANTPQRRRPTRYGERRGRGGGPEARRCRLDTRRKAVYLAPGGSASALRPVVESIARPGRVRVERARGGRMRSRARLQFLVAVGAVTLVSLVAAASSSTAFGSNPPGTLYVSPTGSPTAAGTSCGTATFSHIGAAVAAAPSGGTVVVCPGTYAEDV